MNDGDYDELELSPREELAEIVSSFRAYLQWSQDVGTTGIPRDPDAKARAAAIASTLGPLDANTPSSQERKPLSSDEHSKARSTAQAPQSAERQAGLKRASFEVPPEISEPTASPSQQVAEGERRQASKNEESEPSERIAKKSPWALPPEIAQLNAPALQEKLESLCTCTPGSQSSSSPILLQGSAASGLCFVADAPSEAETETQSPFVGEAAELLQRILKGMGLEQDEAAVLMVRPCPSRQDEGNRIIESAELLPYLHRYIQLMRPKVIVSLGAKMTNSLLGTEMPISKMRGQFRLYAGKTALMPTYHPAYLIKAPSAKRDVWFDLKQVLHHLGRDIPVSK